MGGAVVQAVVEEEMKEQDAHITWLLMIQLTSRV